MEVRIVGEYIECNGFKVAKLIEPGKGGPSHSAAADFREWLDDEQVRKDEAWRDAA